MRRRRLDRCIDLKTSHKQGAHCLPLQPNKSPISHCVCSFSLTGFAYRNIQFQPNHRQAGFSSGMTMMRGAFLFMVLLSVSWVAAATEVGDVDFTLRTRDEISGNKNLVKETLVSKELIKNQQICTLCEEFAGQALEYMLSNKTQEEIVQILHKSCSKLHSFKKECVTLVDYYVPLFFRQISLVEPQDFCHKIDLCQKIALFSSQLQTDSCAICHHTISDILVKLKDPDTQLEIIQLLLKLCKSLDKNARKCKQLVFEFGPIILTNAEQFLEKTDICTLLHACTPSREEGLQVLKADW